MHPPPEPYLQPPTLTPNPNQPPTPSPSPSPSPNQARSRAATRSATLLAASVAARRDYDELLPFYDEGVRFSRFGEVVPVGSLPAPLLRELLRATLQQASAALP